METTPDPAASAARVFRTRQLRRFGILVTLPGLLLGSASIAAAFGAGLLDPPAPRVCLPDIVAAPPRSSFTITVQNSNETAGEGRAVAKELVKRGFLVGKVANAPEGIYVKSAGIIYHGRSGRDQALVLARQIPGATLWFDGRGGRNVELVIGYGFEGLIDVPPPPPPKTSEINVNVYNTTWRAGLASSAAEVLSDRKFRVREVGNDPIRSFLPDDVAVLRFGPDALDAAKVLHAHLPTARLAQDDRPGKVIDLVLGNGYTEFLALSHVPVAPVPPPTPPETIDRRCSP